MLPISLLLIAAVVLTIVVINGHRTKKQWIQTVQSHQGEWPDEVIQTVLAHPQKWTIQTLESVMGKHWDSDTVVSILNGTVKIGMTGEMILASWGKPSEIQDKEITRNGKKTRWVYGIPRRGAQYLWFTDDELTKIGN